MRLLLIVLGLAALLAASQQATRLLAPPPGGRLAERAIVAARAVPAPASPVVDLAAGGAAPLARPGEVTVATLWATWCAICRTELPRLDALRARWAGRGVEIRAVSIDAADAASGVPVHLAALGVDFAPLHDATGGLAAGLGLVGTPSTYVIDRFGNVVAAFVGPGPWEDPATDDWLAALIAAETPEASRALLSSGAFAGS